MPDPRLTVPNAALSDLNVCIRCGSPTHTVSTVCMPCLDKQYLVEQMDRLVEVLGKNPGILIETARDRAGRLHLVSLATPKLAWCNEQLFEVRSKRRRRPAGQFPAGTCNQCLRIYHEAVEKCHARSQAAE